MLQFAACAALICVAKLKLRSTAIIRIMRTRDRIMYRSYDRELHAKSGNDLSIGKGSPDIDESGFPLGYVSTRR